MVSSGFFVSVCWCGWWQVLWLGACCCGWGLIIGALSTYNQLHFFLVPILEHPLTQES